MITKTQNRFANLFFNHEGQPVQAWELGDAFAAFTEAQKNGGRGWGLALQAWAELGDAEAQQANELKAVARHAAGELASMENGYRVDTVFIAGSVERLQKQTDKVEELCTRLNSFVLILTDRERLSL